MKERSVLIALGIVNVVVLGLFIGLYIKKDRVPPVITIEKEGFIYQETMEEAELLAGVFAEDLEDGDVSSSLVVEKVVPNTEKKTALITYGARDSKGNMGKATCKVEMEVIEEEAEQELLSEMLPVAGEAGNRESAVPIETEEVIEETASQERIREEAGENEAEAPREEVPEERETATEEQAATPPAPTAPPADEETPTLRFGKTEVTTVKGQNPAWVNFIGELKDNKDNYEYLLNHLKIDGKYDRNKEGTYSVKVSAVDSDGNESKATSITIQVK